MSYNTAGNTVPERFTGNSAHFDGDKKLAVMPPSINTQMRQEAEQKILSYGPLGLEKCLNDVFSDHESEIRAYVLAKGESPKPNINGLALQAIFLRANDIAQEGKAIDVSDEEALEEIERTEAGLQEINSPDMYSALSMPTQAAIKVSLDKLSDLHTSMGGSGKMIDILYMLKYAAPPSSTAPINNADGNILDSASTDAYVGYFDLGGVFNNDVSNDAPYTTSVLNSGVFSEDTSPGLGSTTNAGAPSSSGGGIFGILTGILNGATSVANAVKGAANATAGASGAVKNAAAGVGANAISQYVQNNKGTIIFMVIILIVIILIIIYAAKHRSK